MSLQRCIIVDYGTGNLNSIKRTFARMAIDCGISSLSTDIAAADKIILPGVGHFATAMSILRKLDLIETLREQVLVERKPVLGICLGMELMARTSEEGDVAGLGWIDAETVRFNIGDKDRYKVPHMGWNGIVIKKASPLIDGVGENSESEFYFAHSYHLRLNDASALLAETEYGVAFPSAIAEENIFGVQFHPEKSHDDGARLLKNFVEM